MITTKSILVKKAEHIDGFRLSISFSDGFVRTVDFAKVFSELIGDYARYNKPAAFKKFKIQNGNVSWGKDDAVIFQVHQLYTAKFPSAIAKKKITKRVSSKKAKQLLVA